MKKGFKKLFAKKQLQESGVEETVPNQSEGYVTMETKSLQSLTNQELFNIIYRYDAEVKHLNQQLTEAVELSSTKDSDYLQAKEELRLFKEHVENLQGHVSRLSQQYGEVAQKLENKQAELEILNSQGASKDSVIFNYRTQNEDLKIQLAEMSSKLEELPINMTNSSNCCEDKDKEIQRLRTELAKSKQLSQETTRTEQEINELRLSIKMQESEIRKFSMNNEQLQTQNKNMHDKISQQDKLKSEMELELHKKQFEIDSMQKEASRHQFHRDSLESEIRAIKDSLQQKNNKLNKRQHKYEALNEQLIDKNSQLVSFKHELEVKTAHHRTELLQLQENYAKEFKFREELMHNKLSGLEKELDEKHKGGEESGKKLKDLIERIEEKDKEIRRLENDAHTLKSQIDSYKFQVGSQETENKNLKENLEKVQKKRELAKHEVMKLSSKLSNVGKGKPPIAPMSSNSSIESTTFKISHIDVANSDLKVLPQVKNEVDTIYKQLMRLMMNSCPYTNSTQGVSYSISSEEFSQLERKLNNLLMQIHETIENPPSEPTQDSWLNPITSTLNSLKNRRAPIKLFSCMTSQDNNPTTTVRPRTQQGQRLASNTGGAIAPSNIPDSHTNQRRGSVDQRIHGYKKF